MGPKPRPVEQRLERLIDRSAGQSACWPWIGFRNKSGYGAIHPEIICGVKAITAHRAAWLLANGVIPDGMCVCHCCDNPPCCNPSHLFLGTRIDNNADRHAKGRTAKGEQKPRSVLTEDDVTEMRLAYATDTWTIAELADKFAVVTHAIESALSGRTWAHVATPIPAKRSQGSRRIGMPPSWDWSPRPDPRAC